MDRILGEREAQRQAAEAAKPASVPQSLSEVLAAQRAGTWVDPDAGKSDAAPAYRPLRP